MRINNNVAAINAHRQYSINNSSVAKSVEKLSSGYRINRAGDDAAGLAISEKMRAQIRGLQMASKNSQDAVSLVQTAEGALQESHNILQRMRELAVQSASDTNETSIDRDALNKEFQALIAELDDTAGKTTFNEMGLIDGSYAKNVTTAVSDGAVHASVWAAVATAAGTYNITTQTVTVSPKVDSVSAQYASTISLTVGVANAQVKVEWDEPDTASAGVTNAVNGKWIFGFANAQFTITNQNTGEIRTIDAAGIGGYSAGTSGSTVIDLGDLGKITFTNMGSLPVSGDQFKSLTGAITVWGGVSEQEAVTKDYAYLNGEQVELVDGMNTIVFKNTGISVDLTGPYKSSKAGSASDLSKVEGEITVTKTGAREFVVQTGANQGDELAISIEKMDAYSLGVATAKVDNRLNASAAITQTNRAINAVSTQRAALGALQNRLEHKIANLDTSAENLQAAESRIRDVDMAQEMTAFMKNNILSQASTAMLAQANALPQGVLQLLG